MACPLHVAVVVLGGLGRSGGFVIMGTLFQVLVFGGLWADWFSSFLCFFGPTPLRVPGPGPRTHRHGSRLLRLGPALARTS